MFVNVVLQNLYWIDFLKLSLSLYFTTFPFKYFHYMVYSMTYTPWFLISYYILRWTTFNYDVAEAKIEGEFT